MRAKGHSVLVDITVSPVGIKVLTVVRKSLPLYYYYYGYSSKTFFTERLKLIMFIFSEVLSSMFSSSTIMCKRESLEELSI
jgi:hypothetical protein